MASAAVAAGLGAFKHMQGARTAHQAEIVDQFALRRHGLRADAGAAGGQVFQADFRHQPLQGLAKQPRG